MRRCAALLSLAILAGCETPATGDISGIVAMAQQVMGTDCERAAAREFGIPRRDLKVNAIEGEGRNFHAVGQYPKEGAAELRFDCRYGPDGQFQSINRL
jgi:hypothetical protein